MSFFLSNNEIKIIKNEEKYSYSIEFKKQSRTLINSIIGTHLIIGGTITDNYKTLTFKAITIQTLEEFEKSLLERNGTKKFTHELSMKMSHTLSKQLQYLLTKTKDSFLKYDKKNIVVIDEEIFIYLSNEDLLKREKEELNIILPFSKKEYISPELLNVKNIPERINYRTIYYSLGLLVADCASSDEETEEIEKMEETEEIEKMEETEKMEEPEIKDENILFDKLEKSIGATKLFYFLKRCLTNEVKKRRLVYI